MASQITLAAGSADAKDVEAVLDSLSSIPPETFSFLKEKKVRILVGRDNVTDVAPELKEVRPRNWDEDSTYEKIPGIFDLKRNAVILTVEGYDSPEGPTLGTRHGSSDLAVHEVYHAVEQHSPGVFQPGSEFSEAYAGARPSLDPYEQHEGGGMEEAFAESAARYLSGTPQPEELDSYWDDNMKPSSPGLMGIARQGLIAATPGGTLTAFLASQKF